MQNTIIIFKKQVKDTLKNKAILIQFVMFPLLALLMEKTVHIDSIAPNYFVLLFSSMYIGMAPLSSMSAILSEEKETNTLRVLRMAGISPAQYLCGVGSYVLTFCALGSIVFCLLLSGASSADRLRFLLLMLLGITISGILGAAIGVGSRNQMSATSVSLPVMIVFAFLPMLSMFNDSIQKIARFTYSEQIHLLLDTGDAPDLFGTVVLAANITVFILLFVLLYRKKGLE